MLKNRLSKLEKTKRDKQLENGGIYLVFSDGDTMEISCGQDLLFSGQIESGEKMIKELNTHSIIVRTNIPKGCAM